MYLFYHCDMRNLAVRICNVVGTPDYSRPQCGSNLYNINMTIYKVGGGSVCHVFAIERVDHQLATLRS
jgi:hypothetical protein